VVECPAREGGDEYLAGFTGIPTLKRTLNSSTRR
jgi:hypothetical protein